MIEKIIQFSLKQRLFIVLATVLTAVLGYTAYRSLAIDVFPDPSPPLVQIYTEAHGMAPEEVERLISYPLESSMFGLPKVRTQFKTKTKKKLKEDQADAKDGEESSAAKDQ